MHPLLFHHVVQGNCRYFARNSPATGLHQGISHGIVSTAALQDGQPDIIQSSRDEHGSSAAMRRNSEPNLGMGRKTASEGDKLGIPRLKPRWSGLMLFALQLIVLCGLIMLFVTGTTAHAKTTANLKDTSHKKSSSTSQKGSSISGNSVPKRGSKSSTSSSSSSSILQINMAPDHDPPSESMVSQVWHHPTGPREERFIHRFQNIKIKSTGVAFYTGGDESLVSTSTRPYDILSSSSTSPKSPSMLVLPDSAQSPIPIHYVPKHGDTASCKGWISDPALLVHIRFAHNPWHAVIEGLLSQFQTLRELGYLPLININAEGEVEEVSPEGEGSTCPPVYDPTLGETRPADSCYQARPLGTTTKTCNVTDPSITWCERGVWVHPNATRPVMVYVGEATMQGRWSPLMTSMAGKIRSWKEVEGWCFSNLVVGRSMTFNFDAPPPPVAAQQDNLLSQLDIFVRFFRTAMTRLSLGTPEDWEDPALGDKALATLKSGIKLGKSSVIERVYNQGLDHVTRGTEEELAAVLQDIEDFKKDAWMFNMAGKSATDESGLSKAAATAQSSLRMPPKMPYRYQTTLPRPVVTYLSGWSTLDRAVLNERQVLRHIVGKYNVTLKVIEGRLNDETLKIMRVTDVLIGMHRSVWACSLFLKPGATVLHMVPYGWQQSDGSLIQGASVGNMLQLRQNPYLLWSNPYSEFGFLRREDFLLDASLEYTRHPVNGTWPVTKEGLLHPAWLNQQTYVDMKHFGLYLDAVMDQTGVQLHSTL